MPSAAVGTALSAAWLVPIQALPAVRQVDAKSANAKRLVIS
jgi:hypothetical protein